MTYVDMSERQEGASDTCDFTVQQVTTMSASLCVLTSLGWKEKN